MSYCRFSDGDVYMFASTQGGVECCACRLTPQETYVTELTLGQPQHYQMHGSLNFKTEQDALAHLEHHRAAGHDVPEYALERLRREIAEKETGKDVHTEHCCKDCGCKYGDDDCTVVTKTRVQSYDCGTAYTCTDGGMTEYMKQYD
jgi:hypothetical protein